MKKLFLSAFSLFNLYPISITQALNISNWDIDAINSSRVVYAQSHNTKNIDSKKTRQFYLLPKIVNNCVI